MTGGDWFSDAVLTGSLVIAVPVALVAGLVSFFSPCVVPLLPGYLSYVSGVAVQDLGTARRGRVVLGTALFVLGFTAVFVAGGALFGAVGQQLMPHRRTLSVIGGALLIVLGLVFMGRFAWLQRDWAKAGVPRVGLVAAPLIGVLFGIGWTPCIGPTLTAVLVLANGEGTAGRGAFLTAVYCLGLGVPFLVAALFFTRFTRLTDWVKRHRRAVSVTGGALLVVTGVLLMTGWWDDLVYSMQGWIGGFEAPL